MTDEGGHVGQRGQVGHNGHAGNGYFGGFRVFIFSEKFDPIIWLVKMLRSVKEGRVFGLATSGQLGQLGQPMGATV